MPSSELAGLVTAVTTAVAGPGAIGAFGSSLLRALGPLASASSPRPHMSTGSCLRATGRPSRARQSQVAHVKWVFT